MKAVDRKLRPTRQWDDLVRDGLVTAQVFHICRATTDHRDVARGVSRDVRAIIMNWHRSKKAIAEMLNVRIDFHGMQPKMARETRAFIERIQAMRFG